MGIRVWWAWMAWAALTSVGVVSAQDDLPLAPLPQQGPLAGFSPLGSHDQQPPSWARLPAQPAVSAEVPPQVPRLQLTGHTEGALNFYGGKAARAMLESMPRRQQTATRAFIPNTPSRPKTKPFEHVSNGATVSPYLNLFRNETDSEAAPNYFAFVRPQLQQQQENKRQEHQLQQLNRQLQRVSTARGGTQFQSGRVPSTGHNTYFLNTGQYFGAGAQQ